MHEVTMHEEALENLIKKTGNHYTVSNITL